MEHANNKINIGSVVDAILEKQQHECEEKQYYNERISNFWRGITENYNPLVGLLPSDYLEKRRIKSALFNPATAAVASSICFGLFAWYNLLSLDGIDFSLPLKKLETITSMGQGRRYEIIEYLHYGSISMETARLIAYGVLVDSAVRGLISAFIKPIGSIPLELGSYLHKRFKKVLKNGA
jgi:hypothetical protein